MSLDPTLLDDLEWRGLLAHSTDLDALREALASGSVRFYVGFDPTAPSLHLGNLVQILTAKRLQDAGHTPYALVGGATGMIGDPRDSGERTLNDADTVSQWVERVRRQIEPFLSFEGENAATMVNNLDWTQGLSTIDFLRDIGKHFPVNRMLARETVNYVQIITGLPAETWRDDPPEGHDFRLQGDVPFRAACHDLARNRRLTAYPEPEPAVKPWGVQLAFGTSVDAARRKYSEKTRSCAALVKGETVDYVYEKSRASPRGGYYMARIGRDDRDAAWRYCSQLKNRGCICAVYANG